jgi:hypothetical protein
MTLSYGKFRIFVFPFKLSLQLKNSNYQEKNADNNIETFESLYLVALLPKQKLSMVGTGHWNVSLLIVMFASLLSTVAMLRLFLLPQNHSITRFFRYFVLGSSYLFFITITALLYAYVQNLSLQNAKDNEAKIYTQNIVKSLKADIENVFIGLDKYRGFYTQLLQRNHEETTQLSFENSLPFYGKNIKVISNHGKGIQLPTDNSLPFYSASIRDISNNDDKSKLETYLEPTEVKPNYFPDNILNILVVNKFANSAFPSIYYRENNALPKKINISHRHYYKKVRDNKAYDLTLEGTNKKFNNVYIQRLRNINNGSRGTTISMPLYSKEDENSDKSKDIINKVIEESKSHVIAADVLLPSIDFGQPHISFDFTYMVVDRNTGEVLFHSDENRSMVENLFYAGDNESNLGQWIKAGMDIDEENKKVISGYYHGQAGRFFIKPTVIPSWSVVVFYPKDSLDALMTSQFIYIFICALSLMSLFMLIYLLPKWIIQHISKYDEKRFIPKIYNRSLFLILSILIYIGFGYHVISILHSKSISSSTIPFSQLLHVVNFFLISIIFSFIYSELTTKKSIRWNVPIHLPQIKGVSIINRYVFIVFIVYIILFFQLSFLSKTSNLPIKGLLSHYHKGYCQQINLVNQEITQKALILFPNSITQHSFKVDDIMKSYLPKSIIEKDKCEEKYSEIQPDDLPNLSSLLGTQHLWQWINYYFTDKGNDFTSNHRIDFRLSNIEKIAFSVISIIFLLGWIEFNRQVLWRRLYCPTKMLQHIQNLTDSIKKIESDDHNEKLEINCQGIKLNGVDLNYLLNTQLILKPDFTPQVSPLPSPQTKLGIDVSTRIQNNFVQLFNMSSFLQTFNNEDRVLPNLKIDINENISKQYVLQPSPSLNVNIWDIEVCLDEPEHRQYLLALIMELKSLVLCEKINSFSIYAGFHSLQRVEMKNLLSIEHSTTLEHAEYLSWAECLMDFKMNVPKSFKHGVDQKLLQDELVFFPELSHIISEPVPPCIDVQRYEKKEILFGDPLIPRSISEWSTMKYILLHAEPLYRFKWELCTSAEKLALYNLAKHRGLNPENTKMIEHLALNGLIIAEGGHLALVNKSFAQFVLYAETNETIAELERTGEHGLWKSYRLPIALLIILIIGGVAMTSGQSIYIIAASLLGILTTIASVTNSANLLRNQLK